MESRDVDLNSEWDFDCILELVQNTAGNVPIITSYSFQTFSFEGKSVRPEWNTNDANVYLHLSPNICRYREDILLFYLISQMLAFVRERTKNE